MSSKKNSVMMIAGRISGRNDSGRGHVMIRIATATVAISITVMIISLAVINGFRDELTGKLTGFDSHVQIINMTSNASLETPPIVQSPILEAKLKKLQAVKTINAYAQKGGIIKTGDAIQGVLLKGYGPDYDWDFFRDNLMEGDLPCGTDSVRTKNILLSSTLSTKLGLNIGDRVEMLFMQPDRPPRRDLFRLSGIYNSGFEEADMLVVLTDIRNVQRLNGWDYTRITGYEVNGFNIAESDALAGVVADITGRYGHETEANLFVSTLEERNPNVFDWLRAHNVNAAVIIGIMLIVALLNMASALLIILLQRTRMIGILKSLGMPDGEIRKIFIIRSAYIIVKGLVIGNIIGIGLCLLQKYTGWVSLDSTGYVLSTVPVSLSAGWLLWLNAGTFIILVMMMAVPTIIVTKVRPETSLRYQ